MKASTELIGGIIEKLEKQKKAVLKDKIFIGFDGYVDKIRRPVKIRTGKNVEFYETITDFSERLALAAGKSGQVELVTEEVKLGGNAPIMANALGHLGIRNFCLGNAGFPTRHPAYNSLHDKVTVLSAGNPAESIALEFRDGKIILSELSVFRQLDWEQVKKTVSIESIRSSMDECDVLALVGWCNPDHATDVWKGLLHDVISESSRKKLIFFDLADPTKKSRDDLLEVLEVINAYGKHGTVVLGLNENETLKLSGILSDDLKESGKESLAERGKLIFNYMSIAGLLVHPVERSIYITADQALEIEGHLVKEPKISTGGGDNLNAGFCFGFLMGFTPEESMILGMATSGSYVQNGRSPDIEALIRFLREW